MARVGDRARFVSRSTPTANRRRGAFRSQGTHTIEIPGHPNNRDRSRRYPSNSKTTQEPSACKKTQKNKKNTGARKPNSMRATEERGSEGSEWMGERVGERAVEEKKHGMGRKEDKQAGRRGAE